MMRPSAGSTANWMLQPPVSTPTARMMSMPMSRSFWYSRSVSVSAGATVIESPVCTPTGSTFSIEQTTTVLSAVSRMSSSSYSFQPRIDSSSSTSVRGRVVQALRRRCGTRSLSVVREAGAEAAHRERGADDERVAEVGGERRAPRRCVCAMCDARDIRAGLEHELLEELAVLALVDRLEASRR